MNDELEFGRKRWCFKLDVIQVFAWRD